MIDNVFEVNFGDNKKEVNNLGMREMQEKVYKKRDYNYLLVKAPPASGKSRALMFVALDKLNNQGIKKVIVAVPEKSIGKSFKSTNLKNFGFYYNWTVEEENNLATAVGEKSKVKRFIDFINSNNPKDNVIIVTHSTLRYAFEELDESEFDNTLLAIDEFHHVSDDESSVLGNAIRNIMNKSNAHILAMTGSYFRGDTVPILNPIDEEKFEKVTYTYYEQLDNYEYLKSFSMGFDFYHGNYLDSLEEVIDTNKKSIIYIPNVNSSESTKDKYGEVDEIIDIISDGGTVKTNQDGIYEIIRPEGRKLLVADLVNEDGREKVSKYLSEISDDIKDIDKLDIIISLGMAKEGFDWPFAEYALTIGYRKSLTEVVQIIGRVTRDSPNKRNAQYVNLIAQPDANDDEVIGAVNNIMKAISASLLMEQVLAPKYTFKPKKSPADKSNDDHDVRVLGLKDLNTTDRTKKIIENDMEDLKESIIQNRDIQRATITNQSAEFINKTLVPRVIMKKYPDMSLEEVDVVRQHLVSNLTFSSPSTSYDHDRKLIKLANGFINVDKLSIDLIDRVNTFSDAYKILSKKINSLTLKFIKNYLSLDNYDFTEEELVKAYYDSKDFKDNNKRPPRIDSSDENERYLGLALLKLKQLKASEERGN